MKKILLLALSVQLSSSYAQNADQIQSNWTKKGVITFLANQSSFNNWIAGGVDNISGTLGLNYDFNYLIEHWTWDNKLIANFGITKIKGQEVQKSSDLLEFNSILGKKAKNLWHYSFFLNFKTQFADDLDKDTKGPTRFLSPAYIQFGPGLFWKKSDNLKINFAPATSRFIIVDKSLTLPNEEYFGVREGKSSRYELGASISAYYKLNLMKNISMENILNLFSNYLNEARNIDLDYSMNLIMTVNKYISANFSIQTIYDDNAFRGLQTRQVFGIGVNYDF